MKTKVTVEIRARVGQQSSIKKFSNGKSYLSFTCAHNEQWKDAKGQTVERTTWWSVLYAVKEGSALVLEPGSFIIARGSMSTNLYKDKQGQYQVGYNLAAKELDLYGRFERKGVLEEIVKPEKTEREYDFETAPNIPGDLDGDLPF